MSAKMVSKTTSERSVDKFPIEKFQELAETTRKKPSQILAEPVTSAERLYQSLLHDIKSIDMSRDMNFLMKKASGILKLDHCPHSTVDASFPNREREYEFLGFEDRDDNSDELSFDFYGGNANNKGMFSLQNRVPSTAPPLSRPMSQGPSQSTSSRTNVRKPKSVVIAHDDSSEFWDRGSDISSINSSYYTDNYCPSYASSTKSSRAASMIATQKFKKNTSNKSTKKPKWKPVGTATKSVGNDSSQTDLESARSNLSTARSVTSNASTIKTSDIKVKTKRHPRGEEGTVKNVFVVNGTVVAFKGFGFENFSNWFGDEKLLKSDPSYKHGFSKEFDLAGYDDKDIRLKLYDGYKLVIEANKSSSLMKGTRRLPSIRFKEKLVLPRHIPVEILMICRTSTGRLIIRDAPPSLLESRDRETKDQVFKSYHF